MPEVIAGPKIANDVTGTAIEYAAEEGIRFSIP